MRPASTSSTRTLKNSGFLIADISDWCLLLGGGDYSKMPGITSMRESQNGHSSSPELSSPPSGNFSPPHLVAKAEDFGSRLENGINVSLIDNGHEKTAKRSVVRDSAAPKRPRKKKEPESSNTLLPQHGEEIKPKKPRIQRGTGPRAMRKKAELEAKKAAEEAELQAAAQQHSKSQPGFVRPAPPPNNPNNSFQIPAPPQSGNREAIPASYTQSLTAHNPTPRPLSGQNYDPIRSSTLTPGLESPMHAANTPTKPSAAINAARSPSISSLVDPPDSTRSYTPYMQQSKRNTEFKPTSPRDVTKSRLSPPPVRTTLPDSKSPPLQLVDRAISSTHATEANGANLVPSLAPPKTGTITTKPPMSSTKGPSSGSHSPKPAPRKDAAPLPTAGSGLLSGAMFGGANGAESAAGEKSAPTVIIHVQLKGDNNNTINFTKLAEAKYGFNALHPRLAAQKDRLARVAAAGAALENANRAPLGGQSADDMSVDLSNDEGDNSNIEMGGMDDRNGFGLKSGEDTGEAPKRRKRIMKEDMYDKDDDFIDDAEQIWEEQAAVSKDGFFVYSGPLVPEGEEAKVERYESNPPILQQRSRLTNHRAAANPPKRGGRGGGRGGRGGGAGGRGRANKDNKDGKPVVKRVRRSRSQIERDARDEAQRKAKKDSLTLLASKPATTDPSQPIGGPMQHQQQMPT